MLRDSVSSLIRIGRREQKTIFVLKQKHKSAQYLGISSEMT